MTTEKFKKEVLQSDLPVLMDFYAPWCGPCQTMGPVVDAIKEKLSDRAKIIKLDIEQNSELATKYHVMSVPTFLIFKDGKVTSQLGGIVTAEELTKKILK